MQIIRYTVQALYDPDRAAWAALGLICVFGVVELVSIALLAMTGAFQ